MNATLIRITAKIAAPAVGIGMLAGATAIFANAAPSARFCAALANRWFRSCGR